MTELLFQENSYLRQAKARVIAIANGAIVLDRTIFVPAMPLQPNDLGKCFWHGYSGRLLAVEWQDGLVLHKLAGPLPAIGQYVRLKLNWRRRYDIMRLRTAAYLAAGILARDFAIRSRLTHFTDEQARLGLASFDVGTLRHLEDVCRAGVAAGAGISQGDGTAVWDETILTLATVRAQYPFSERLVEITGVGRFRDRGLFVKDITEIGWFDFQRTGKTSVAIRLSRLENQS
jgi:Ser-tRNA(Ala) deacylase AlaX